MNKDITSISSKAFFSLIGTFIEVALIMALNIILSRTIDLEGLSAFFSVYNIIVLIALIVKLGFDSSLIAFIPKLGSDQLKKDSLSAFSILVTFFLALAISLIFYFFNDELATFLFNNPKTALYIRQQSFLIVILSLTHLSRGIFLAYNRYNKFIIAKNLILPITSIISVLVLVFGFKITTANTIFWVYYISWGSTVIYIAIYLFKNTSTKIPLYEHLNEYKKFFLFSLPLMLSKILSVLVSRSNIFFIGYLFLNKGVVIYSSASKIATLISYVVYTVSSMFSPKISSYVHENRINELHKIYAVLTRWVMIINMAFLILVVTNSKFLMILFNDSFSINSSTLIILAFGQVFGAVFGSAGTINIMSGYPRSEVLNNCIGLIINTLICIYLIPTLGINGAAIAFTATNFSLNLFRMIILYSNYKITPFTPHYFGTFLAGIISYFIASRLKTHIFIENEIMSIIINSSLLMLIFAILTWFLALTKEEKKSIIHFLKSNITILSKFNKSY